jgi:hypothetical protein
VPVQQAPGARPVRLAVAGAGPGVGDLGAIGDALGGHRLAGAAADLAATDGGMIFPCDYRILGHQGILWIAALGYDPTMSSETQALPEDPAALRLAAESLVSLVQSQALRIAKLEHQLAGRGSMQRNHQPRHFKVSGTVRARLG